MGKDVIDRNTGKTFRRADSPPISVRQLVETMPPARILWLRYHSGYHAQAERLMRVFEVSGAQTTVVNLFELTESQLAQTDLVLLDASDRIDAVIETVVARIRMESRVPIVVVAESYTIDQLVQALAKGVDVVCPLNVPLAVFVARCKAILRRWQTISL